MSFSSSLLVMFTVHLSDTFQETTKQFLQTRSILVITFYRDQAAQLQKAAEVASLAYNTNDSNLRIVTVDAAQGR
jgi:superfamily I DNA and/or RNA helicase